MTDTPDNKKFEIQTNHTRLAEIVGEALTEMESINNPEYHHIKLLLKEAVDMLNVMVINKVTDDTKQFAEDYGQFLSGVQDYISSKTGCDAMILFSTPDKTAKESQNITMGQMAVDKLSNHIFCLFGNIPGLKEQFFGEISKAGIERANKEKS